MTPSQLTELVQALLTDATDNTEVHPDAEGISHVRTYAEACMLTHDDGLVVYMADGSELTITITQRR